MNKPTIIICGLALGWIVFVYFFLRMRAHQDWVFKFAEHLHKQLEGNFSMEFCREAAEAHIEVNRGDLTEDPIECAEAEFDAMRDACS